MAGAGDVNGDGVVNDTDLLEVFENLPAAPDGQDPNADLNGDGQVDVGDLVHLVNYMFKQGPLPPPC